MSENRFLHICYTSYHCYGCRDNFQYKQRKKEFTQEEREDLNKKDKILICCLCDKKHFRCKSKKYDKCCKRNACDSYLCKHCLENGIDCKYTIVQSLEELKSFIKYNLIAYAGQLEYTKEGKDYTIWIPEKKVRSDSDENILYATKEYNPCVRHKKRECKCHHGDNICEICNDECSEKTKSRIEGLSSEVRPFKFGNFRYIGDKECNNQDNDEIENNDMEDDNDNRDGKDNIDHKTELQRKKNEEFDAIIKRNKMLLDSHTPLEVFKRNRGKVTYSSNYSNIGKIYRNVREEKMNLRSDRFWHPFTVYIYGPGGSGKTGFIKALFRDELYDKPKKKRNSSNWWNKYKGQKIVLLDEFYTKIDWDNIVNILNDNICDVELKHGGFVPFIAKYVFLTNTKPPEEAYNFGQNGHEEDSNKCSFEQFDRRLDIIIEFRGDEQKFRNMEWDVEYNNSKYTVDKILEKAEVFTEGLDDYPNCKKMVEYRQIKRKKSNDELINNKMSLKRKRELEDYRKNDYILNNNISVEEIIMNPRLMPSGRFWHPLTFYFYGFGAEIVRELFGDELYDKPDIKKNRIGWDSIVNILNDTEHSVEIRYGRFKYFLAKYIFMTDMKLPQETYNFNGKGWENWSQFERRLDYIIEFKDNKFIFHKGNRDKFLNME
ncbi:5238_t:CDS:2 [Scutellospora calospora]|uniref:5238_t:CDS:1 n=1 Tax=Scutellospora calospora TaxID=85575 RepID=A0ACA9JTZ7_9GLOM|nr:5238_t:CDS:2 [Scutellospora calospora]